MKLKCQTKFANKRAAAYTSFTGLIVFASLLITSLPAKAQGVVHIAPGSNYLFSNPKYLEGKIDELGATTIVIDLGFTGDIFTSGDNMQVDVLSTPTSLTPLLTSTFSYPAWTFGIHNQWLGVPWNAGNGAIRLTMLSGSVDVSSFSVRTTLNFSELDYSYTIPEPSSSLLLLFSGAVLGGVHWFDRRKMTKG